MVWAPCNGPMIIQVMNGRTDQTALLGRTEVGCTVFSLLGCTEVVLTISRCNDRLVKAAYDFNLQFASSFTAECEGSSSAAPPPPLPPPPQPPPAQPMQQQQPPAAQQPNMDTQMLPPMSIAQLTFQLEGVGFARSRADNNGDCYPLSAMAGFEMTAAAACNPTTATTAKVRQ
eukprot:410233-Prymnesium_polylepis.1